MRRTTLAGCGVVIALALTACSGGTEAPEENGEASEGPVESTAFGPDCADLPSEGPGSLASMAEQPFLTAVAENPGLSRLASALERSGLERELAEIDDMTVFAPVDDAFDIYPEEQVRELFNDADLLAYLIGHHVTLGEYGSRDLVEGSLPTFGGDRINTAEKDGEYTIEGYSPVVCADVRTTDATVHMVGMLLIPT
ncbi:fasciclin domain-containing protein [Nocardiopsis alba]|uniref:fasciclin domain-containing protein n=1 Tax=Nocardiopsis alba TaxID=53437 RepID=UPI0033EE230C